MARANAFDAVPQDEALKKDSGSLVRTGLYYGGLGAAWGAAGAFIFGAPFVPAMALGAAACLGVRMIGGKKAGTIMTVGTIATPVIAAGLTLAGAESWGGVTPGPLQDFMKMMYTAGGMMTAFGAATPGASKKEPVRQSARDPGERTGPKLDL